MIRSRLDSRWQVYLRTLALGSGAPALSAKLLISVGGNTPKATYFRIERLKRPMTDLTGRGRRNGRPTGLRLDPESIRVRSDALKLVSGMYDRQEMTHRAPSPSDEGWVALGDGSVVRATLTHD